MKEYLCVICGSPFISYPSVVKNGRKCCSQTCGYIYNKGKKRPHLSEYNRTRNPMNKVRTNSIVDEKRLTHRQIRLGSNIVGYRKYFGRHEHRVVAEQMLGRPLMKGEVVHHINRIKSDNRPENLMVFPNQIEHMKFHMKGGDENDMSKN